MPRWVACTVIAGEAENTAVSPQVKKKARLATDPGLHDFSQVQGPESKAPRGHAALALTEGSSRAGAGMEQQATGWHLESKGRLPKPTEPLEHVKKPSVGNL